MLSELFMDLFAALGVIVLIGIIILATVIIIGAVRIVIQSFNDVLKGDKNDGQK